MIRKKAITGLTKDEAEFARSNALRVQPQATVTLIEQDDSHWTVLVVWDDAASPPPSAAPLPAMAAAAMSVAALPLALGGTESNHMLGELSAKYESTGNPASIGFDSTGGFSYGTYQIATRTSTMDNFLKFLRRVNAGVAQQLDSVGGAEAARRGEDAFKQAWKNLARQPEFFDLQHAFVHATHYAPLCEHLQEDLNLDVPNKCAAIQDVVWSVSVQHGSASKVIQNALKNLDLQNMRDREMIQRIYAERSKLERYFSSSTPKVRAALQTRFTQEERDALHALG